MTYRVALLPGDGVGPEVIAEARKAVDVLSLSIEWTELPWGSAYYHWHGRMMPEDGLDRLQAHDAVLLGAIGDAGEIALETSVFTRAGVERVVRHAFRAAQSRRGLLTSATKSNASRYGYVLWDEVVHEVSSDYPEIRVERVLVDALSARMVRDPGSLDVVVSSNLFADILTDIAAAIQGGMGMAASANVAPGTAGKPGVFEPVHGSAPDIAGRGIANPTGAIWSASLMLDHLGELEAAQALMTALEATCHAGPRTRDVGGVASTAEVGDAVAERIARL